VLDGSVNGGLRLTAQLGDRVYRGVLFTQPAAVRLQRTSLATDSSSSSQQQQQAAKRHKPASANSAAPSDVSSSTPAIDSTVQPP